MESFKIISDVQSVLVRGYALGSVGRLCASAGLSTCVSSLFPSKKFSCLVPVHDYNCAAERASVVIFLSICPSCCNPRGDLSTLNLSPISVCKSKHSSEVLSDFLDKSALSTPQRKRSKSEEKPLHIIAVLRSRKASTTWRVRTLFSSCETQSKVKLKGTKEDKRAIVLRIERGIAQSRGRKEGCPMRPRTPKTGSFKELLSENTGRSRNGIAEQDKSR